MTWRGWVLFAGAGAAVAFGYRGDWTALAVTTGCVLLPVAVWVGGEMAATRAMLQGQPVNGKHRKRGFRAAAISVLTTVARIPLP